MTMTEQEAKVLRNYADKSHAIHTIYQVVAVLARVALKEEAIRQATGKRPTAEIKRAIAADSELSLRECARKHSVGVGVVRGVRKSGAQS